MELKSVKSQSDTTLARLTQIENRFANLEGRQNSPASREGHDNDDDYYHRKGIQNFDPDYPENY